MRTTRYGPVRFPLLLWPVVALAVAACPAAAWDGPPSLLASCGGSGAPFVMTITPATVNAGSSYTISWCNATWASGAYGFTTNFYYIYQDLGLTNNYTYIADYGSSTFSVSFPTTASDIGLTKRYLMRAWGRAIDPGGNYDAKMDSNIAPDQIGATGGGGGVGAAEVAEQPPAPRTGRRSA